MRRPMKINGNVGDFKYLGSFVQKGGGFGMDVKHRIKCGLMKWREVLGSCNKTSNTFTYN
jgi:hypothetical protein